MIVRMFTHGVSLFCLAALVSVTGSALPITNFSFETLPPSPTLNPCAGAGCSFTVASQGAIPGWTASSPSDSGQFNPGTSGAYLNSVPDGSWVGYVDTGNLTQVVGTVSANTMYTMTVDLGLRIDFPELGSAELLIGSTPVIATGVAPTSGNWSTYTAIYTSLAGDVGKTITIELLANPNGAQAVFDDVALNTASTGPSSVPEPSTTASIAVGLIGLGLLARARLAARSRKL